PYQQSKRLDLYRKYALKLVDDGNAYYCFCSRERLDEIRKAQQKAKQQPKYDRHCCDLEKDDVEQKLASDTPYVIRMKVPEGKSKIQDMIRGEVVIDHSEVDDQVILKSDGFPTYHLAVVVDDHFMEITTVIRGEEWLPSTPKHLILFKMLGWDAPKFAHVPLLLNPDKSKLSKRQGDVAAESYLDRGYLPEAIVNFVSTLGYNPTADREIYEPDEFIDMFNLSKVKKSGAVVNFEKLDWMNKQYMMEMDTDELKNRLKPFLKGDEGDIDRIIEVEKSRQTTLVDLASSIAPFKELQGYDAHILIWRKSDGETAVDMLKEAREYIDGLDRLDDVVLLEASVKQWIKEQGIQTGDVLWPLRVALSGSERSPSPFEYIYVIGKTETLYRIDSAINKLKGGS
ncbi:MAG TPA: glutamate--tRNA ligase, partial [Patescibacteria group bacterium]|nr:glutamate--tRNA ligase [Patescibacteria group bacterium]